MAQDIEHGRNRTHYISGYPSLAAFIASDNDKSTAIFRRFDRLSARNLLYLQSELAELEARQDEFDGEDGKDNDMEAKQCARSWTHFKKKSEKLNNEREKKRMDLVKEIREKIKEYREAILLESTLLSLPPPSARTLEAFRSHFHNVDRGDFPTLGGRSAHILDDSDDLIALRTPMGQDRMTKLVREHLGIFFQTSPPDGHIANVSDRGISRFVAWFSVVLAAVLLIGAIASLYVVQSPNWRLGMIASFTVLFAICVGLLTNAMRAEVFGATAAYAAVLVVFVSGNLGGPTILLKPGATIT
ncbi:hypothetical protein FGG08_003810 [Glutinoglossum americanum]|uniref:DUF6594 domain-containing protein n=1 Tax=Glutinoglossum americanum TaxID=1670608 RepID=A0A9P8L4F6_9PEZI|nr:hypothetical protein FGG08_003810 [Glutinoglossum americanum]